MNSDYILTGKGQITLQQPDWAKFTPARSDATAPDTDFGKTLDTVNTSKTAAKSAGKHGHAAQAKSAEMDEAQAQPVNSKPRFNSFTHSGYGKSVGPGVDTVDFTFDDFVDIINPLQHIPIVNMIYREVTGDKISGVSKVAGSALFFGPLGIVTAAMDAAVNQEKGADMGETMIAGLMGRDPPSSFKNKSMSPEGDKTGVTMLADAGDSAEPQDAPSVTPSAAPLPTAPHHKLATKQPFGGVMGTQDAANEKSMAQTVANEAQTPDEDISEEAQSATSQSAKAVPVAHAPVSADGQKMFSLAGVPHHVGSPARMPMMNTDDVRFKSYGKPTAPAIKAAEQAARLPDVQNTKPISQLEYPDSLPSPGLSAPGFMPSASAYMPTPSTTPSTTTGGNALPAALIQDMMMLNMQKYQDGLKNGNLSGGRGSSVDIEG